MGQISNEKGTKGLVAIQGWGPIGFGFAPIDPQTSAETVTTAIGCNTGDQFTCNTLLPKLGILALEKADTKEKR